MTRKIIDLSMPVHNDMKLFPGIKPTSIEVYEDWEQAAKTLGTWDEGVKSLTAHYAITLSDHTGTHIDSVKHIRGADAPGPEGIPLDMCLSDGVVLDMRHLQFGAGIAVADLEQALDKIAYELKPKDIVLIQTGASAYNTEDRYLKDHVGMTGEATRWLISKGVRVMGTDAPTFDPPVWAMFERKQFWHAHKVMEGEDYWHVENLTNLDKLPRHGFLVSVLPVNWVGTTGAPVRAIGIVGA
ncbi:cyclase family protein [Chelativorans sp. M5D2P16]|uniref:cyclase family protein n=1 Tax=Chelativorans sp. M5D2P16 TaxID=3095678 RepID=UPI002ACAF0D6|nr:cyclase family protein [Chelativorans sp. M5D2P16]MDZ5697454.1 cyclase family protein [Chelativorans sp. M5D2P16]